MVLGKYQSLEVSTPWAYTAYRQEFGHEYAHVSPKVWQIDLITSILGALVRAIAAKDAVKIGQRLYNDLEKVVLPAYPLVESITR